MYEQFPVVAGELSLDPAQMQDPGVSAAAAGLRGGASGAASFDVDIEDVVASNSRLLVAISQGDYLTYKHLVDEKLTCFEPEGCGHLVQGLDFHKYYFDRSKREASSETGNVSVVQPHVRIFGDTALMAYVRLVQVGGKTARYEETRLWRRTNQPDAVTSLGKWKLVHFHRSSPKTSFAP
ncbi:hypothetical protein CTAYLR_009613 [Chrysophaeum taylorii]|uniref:Calcium/calmodulin-dependent protein kinase II association-domain domain-containing protein n=1 Tax=Chrysophaeum taylorii TaxID=2483200 RepID=A0AAD7UQA6_9STRA|nr:hypothetical protein CTAYLR_009613 [Chrysophaeum taylorii]